MSPDEGLLLVGIFILCIAIVHFIANIKSSPKYQTSVQPASPEPYCLHSQYGCCPRSSIPRNDEIGSNC